MSSTIKAPAMPEPTRQEEQAPFEAWADNYSPSGDCESVQRQWKESSWRESWLQERDAYYRERDAQWQEMVGPVEKGRCRSPCSSVCHHRGMNMSHMDDIYQALVEGERAAAYIRGLAQGVDAWDRVRSRERVLKEGMKAFERLREEMRRRPVYVEPPEDYKRMSCGCQDPGAVPPCSWCTDPDNDPGLSGDDMMGSGG